MTTHFDNLDYFNKKRLLDNEVYGYLLKLKEMRDELPEIASGLDYYKMWLSQYSRNKDSLTAKSNMEDFIAYICEKMREYNKIIIYLIKNFEETGGEEGLFILKFVLDFVFDKYKINTIKKIYKIKKQKDLLLGLKILSISLKKYWG